MGFFPVMPRVFRIHTSISVTHHTNKWKNKNHMIISMMQKELLTNSKRICHTLKEKN